MDGKTVALRALIQASMYGVVILFILLLLNAVQVLLVIYAGILLAVLLHGMSAWTAHKTGLPEEWSLALSILVPLAVLGVGGWLIVPDVADQASDLADRLPRAVEALKQYVLQFDWANRLWASRERLQQWMPESSSGVGAIAGVLSSSLNALGNLVFAVFVGLFLAVRPQLYIHGSMRLIPKDKRGRARDIANATGATLRSWLIAKLSAMAAIGVLTTLGLWLLGIDLALVLGFIAAMLSFIPNFGPIASVIPAALIALFESPEKAFYVLLLYIAVQIFESYLLTPLLQQHLVDLPPALLLAMQVLLGTLAGVLGIILATPLTAAGMVIVRMWYVEDMLGDKVEQHGQSDKRV